MTRKLDFAIESTGLKPETAVLDIGRRLGRLCRTCDVRGIKVDRPNDSEQSEKFVEELISQEKLRARSCGSTFSSTKLTDPMTLLSIVELLNTCRLSYLPGKIPRVVGSRGEAFYLMASAPVRNTAVSHSGRATLSRQPFAAMPA